MSNYNQKLFSGGIRGYLHHMRFNWLKKHITASENSFSLFELGCFDCRSLGFIPKPTSYVGADAGWENGLDEAQMNYANVPWMELVSARSVHDLENYRTRRFDYSVALETLEHIPDHVLEGYIEFLAQVTTKRLLVSVPVEIGPVFLAKHLAKRLIPNLESGDTDTYTLAEVYWATRGRTDKVRRFEHKGFDYRKLIELLSKHFIVTHVEGIPFKSFPYWSFQVGIVAEPKVVS